MTHTTIAYIEPDHSHRSFYRDVLRREGFCVDSFEHADPALEALVQKEYDLVLLEIKVAPGLDMKDNGLKQEWELISRDAKRMGNESHPDYWRVGHYIIQRVKSEQCINNKKPVVVLSIYDSKYDGLFLDAASRTLTIGADKYIAKKDVNYVPVVQEIKFRLSKKR
ncbi:MAG: hypothetical protein AABX72_00060 [Nanoarchaeota archaeon]